MRGAGGASLVGHKAGRSIEVDAAAVEGGVDAEQLVVVRERDQLDDRSDRRATPVLGLELRAQLCSPGDVGGLGDRQLPGPAPSVLSRLQGIRAGPSEQKFLESVAKHHAHYPGLRAAPIRDGWDRRGTWLTAPLLLDLKLLNRDEVRLQLVEGRMRVGILQGRLRGGFRVASTHKAWVGRGRVGGN